MSAPGIARTTSDVDPLARSVVAGAGKKAAALAIDLALPLVLAIWAVLAFLGGATVSGIVLVVAVLLVSAATVAAVARIGRAFGGAVTGTRLVERSAGAPSGDLLLSDLMTGRLISFDVRRGRDPVSPALAPFRFPRTSATHQHGHVVTAQATAVLDSGVRLTLPASLVIGRNPVAADAGTASEVFQWTDLTRTMSKSHVQLEWDGQHAWVTDLGSTNGSTLQDAGQPITLTPFSRTALPIGAVLSLGDRTLVVELSA